MDWVWSLFSFKGRINRARYVVVQLALVAFWLVSFKLPIHLLPQWEVLNWVISITMIWINLATTAKRLHDRNWSGWWAAAVFALNRLSYVSYGLFFGFGVDVSTAEVLLLVMLMIAMSLLVTWIFIELFFLIGTDGANRFGPDPTREAPQSSLDSQPQSAGVPDFLVRRTKPAPHS